jgi:hypothetical protein
MTATKKLPRNVTVLVIPQNAGGKEHLSSITPLKNVLISSKKNPDTQANQQEFYDLYKASLPIIRGQVHRPDIRHLNTPK